MTYSTDLRSKVLAFIQAGGSKTEAAQHFNVSRAIVFIWAAQPPDHMPGKQGPKASRKFDQQALLEEVTRHPERLLKELAASRGVSINAISQALKRLGMSRKKNTATRAEPPAP